MSNTHVFKLPDLLSMCQFPSSMNPEYHKASAESTAWISGNNALGTGDAATDVRWVKYFMQTDGPLLSAYVYPYAPYDKLRLCCDLINILFGMDEISDGQSGKDARETMERHVRFLYGEPCDGTPVSRMTTIFRESAKRNFRPNAYRRFLKSYENYANAVIVEAELRERKDVPPVEEYRIFRRENGAVKPCFDIIEACFDIDLPDEMVEHPTVQSIYNAALDMVLWSNDLYSYRVERARDGLTCSNLITSLIHENNFTLQQSADYIGTEFQSLITQFLSDKASLPSFGVEADAELRAYIFGLENWIAGNLRFCFDSLRYLGQDRKEIEKTLVVKLYPCSDTEDDSD